MAGGKMSPRQKMINMMYLVLMAMLALNVSAEILDAFENLKNKLNNSYVQASANASEFINSMKAEIDDEVKTQNKLTNIGLKDTLDLIAGKSQDLIGAINTHISEMDGIAQLDPVTGEYLAKDQTVENFKYWMGNDESANKGRGNGKAFELRNQMDEYFGFLGKIYNINASADNKIEPRKIEDQKSQDGQMKPWELFTFDGPVMGNLAMLEALKVDVLEEQKILLDLLNNRLGVATFKADKVVAVDAPMATIVPAGLQFQTKLFVSMSSSQIQPKFSSSSGNIKIEEGGNAAILTVGASGGAIPQGKKEGVQSYSASIQVPKATGGFENLAVEGKFTVRTPEIVITSAAVQNLYFECGNDVNIDVPALGDLYDPIVTASSAEVIQSQKSREKFRIIPSGRKCKVSVSSRTNGQTLKIGDVDYNVIQPPKPTIDMAVNGKRVSGATPVPKTSRVQIKLIPDADFAAGLPADARYGITGITVAAALSLGPPTTVNTINTNGRDATEPIQVSLGTRVRDARPGTKIFIRIEDVYRKNFQGKVINDPRFTEVERTLSIIVM